MYPWKRCMRVRVLYFEMYGESRVFASVAFLFLSRAFRFWGEEGKYGVSWHPPLSTNARFRRYKHTLVSVVALAPRWKMCCSNFFFLVQHLECPADRPPTPGLAHIRSPCRRCGNSQWQTRRDCAHVYLRDRPHNRQRDYARHWPGEQARARAI